MDSSSLLTDIQDIALAAGEAVLRHYAGGSSASSAKADGSPLTAADLEADRIIGAGLRALDPAIPLISEEGGVPEYERRRGWTRFWLVDPLDGTKEFLKRTDDFTVNIALIEGSEPVLGVVCAPARGLLYGAQKGRGAWRTERGGEQVRLRSRPASGADGWIVAESRSHPSPELESFLAGLKVKARLRIGSSLKFCRVADGAADLYPRFGPTMEWDTAAGDAVFRWSGEGAPRVSPLAYNKPSLKNGGFVLGGERLGRDPSDAAQVC
ncbi:MAG: 3'(2'),5'-bisphosphate nucleotidase CysQ [Elusimicrobia bacterium]|nr:3'(2'),5'-bisphosphate nucleotidase CysQ [Elusimicrobiota bacterium]